MQNLISDPCGALSLLLSLLNSENIGDAAKVTKTSNRQTLDDKSLAILKLFQ